MLLEATIRWSITFEGLSSMAINSLEYRQSEFAAFLCHDVINDFCGISCGSNVWLRKYVRYF